MDEGAGAAQGGCGGPRAERQPFAQAQAVCLCFWRLRRWEDHDLQRADGERLQDLRRRHLVCRRRPHQSGGRSGHLRNGRISRACDGQGCHRCHHRRAHQDGEGRAGALAGVGEFLHLHVHGHQDPDCAVWQRRVGDPLCRVPTGRARLRPQVPGRRRGRDLHPAQRARGGAGRARLQSHREEGGGPGHDSRGVLWQVPPRQDRAAGARRLEGAPSRIRAHGHWGTEHLPDRRQPLHDPGDGARRGREAARLFRANGNGPQERPARPSRLVLYHRQHDEPRLAGGPGLEVFGEHARPAAGLQAPVPRNLGLRRQHPRDWDPDSWCAAPAATGGDGADQRRGEGLRPHGRHGNSI
mmetsp:Transcript_11348/g.31930  ORF Transcript_11348/g.31930 Transcript_11348/m.31930 type:complete len:354 (+) Transcript_11348:197-1258(+)